MPKEQLERTAEEHQEATQESKDKFLYNIDVLTERSEEIGGMRLESYRFPDGRGIGLRYTTAKEVENLEEMGLKDPTKASVMIYEPFADKKTKVITYDLRESGALDKYVNIKDFEEELRTNLEEEEAIKRGEISQEEASRRLLEKMEKSLAAIKEEKEVGLTFVSEAELKELNSLLEKTLAEKEKV